MGTIFQLIGRNFGQLGREYGFGMDALIIACAWNTNVIMVWAWMLRSAYALGTPTLLWSGHGCSGHHMLSWNTNVIMVWAWMLRSPYAFVEHERYYGLGNDALLTVFSWNTKVYMWQNMGL